MSARGWTGAGLALVLAGCGGSDLRPLPLRPQPVAYADTLPIPEPPEQREDRELRAMVMHGPLQLAEPWDPGQGEALNLTHMDDVVPSAWWEPRLGYEAISPARLAAGPTEASGAPSASGPLEIRSVKTEGVTPGFTMRDNKGDTYIVKFDPPHLFHLQSAAGVIVNRLMWGAGYHVPEDYITTFELDRLVVDDEATIETDDGRERPLTIEDVHLLLQTTRPLEGDRYLAFASRYVPGVPKGPFLFSGTRDDDPNDHYRHEHRRELRALEVVSAWVNNTDIREGNTLDVYVEPGYLRHYLIDFGATLGSASTRSKHPKDGNERPVDVYRFFARLGTLGLYSEDWEDEEWAPLAPALGYMEGETFDPAGWKAAWTNPAFAASTDADGYWGAKIVGAFTDDHIRAAVAEGGLPTDAAEETLARLLMIRRDRTVAHWFARVSTVEDPLVSAQAPGSLRLSFRDLGLELGVWSGDATVYDWTFSHPALGRVGSGSAQPRTGADQLIDISWSGTDAEVPASDELAFLDLRTRRPGTDPDPARVWLRWDGRGYRVVGLAHGDPEG